MNEELPSATGRKKLDVFEGVEPEIKVRTKKMMMWFIIFAIVMMFAGFTSALIVMYGKAMWVHIVPSQWLWTSNALILVSSITLYAGHKMLRNGRQRLALVFTLITLALGIGFTISQNAAWTEMKARGMGRTTYLNEQGLEASRWNSIGKITGEYGKDFWFEINGQQVTLQDGEYYDPANPARPVTNTVMTTFNASGALLSILIYLHIIHLLLGLIYLTVNSVRIMRGRLNAQNWISHYANSMYWHFLGLLWLYLFAFMFFIY
ncbi:MAG: heme-copper oxidase subunit III [Flavobacteriales bacterium]